MAEPAVCKIRSPLSEAAHRINASYAPSDNTRSKGSSARVRLCRHNVTNQLAAVKIVNRRMAYLVQDSSLAALSKWDNNDATSGPSGEMRVPMSIEREVAILKLIEHPHIMKLYDIWENRSEIYLILEYIDQGDLFTFINSRGRLTEEVSLYFFRQMISAIGYCHSFNICHRDLKPENILITTDHKIKIADFGMAALHQTDTHRLATACGSPHYAAPELLKNRQYRGDRADIWSMGVILFAMLAASLPFDDPDMRTMMEKAKRGHYQMPNHFSLEAQDLVSRMLQVNPERRITLAEIWRHPLVQKYNYLDPYGENGGQPGDLRRGFQYAPVLRADIDPQLVRQLRSMWHMFSEHDLELKLTCETPNDQKAFYWLLHNYRDKQLEDFKPELAHSMSDYHHLKPGAWKKRVSTCEFSQPRANGHGRSVSRFTVISNATETEAGTVQSYDPYMDSQVLQSCGSNVTHAKITVHRDQSLVAGQSPHAARLRSNSAARRPRANSNRTAPGGRPPSSRGSMTSLNSARPNNTRARGPSLRHKRGVDFSHVRKQSHTVGASRSNIKQAVSGTTLVSESAHQERCSQSQSPEPRVNDRGQYEKANGAPAPSTPDPTSMFTEELRHFSSNIAKDCDEAFRSSLIEEESIAGSLAEGDRKQRDSPFTFSVDGSGPTTPATDVSSVKPWDSRPLPPLPSEQSVYRPSSPSSVAPSLYSVEYERGVEQVARLAVPVKFAPHGDRRVVSAPAQSHSTRKVDAMPPISEDQTLNVVSNDKARIVSAPPRTPPKARGVEYLTKVENTIRVVHSPSAPNPVKVPKPLNVRKKAMADTIEERQQDMNDHEHDYSSHRTTSGDTATSMKQKKSKLWFKRSSRAGTGSGTSTAATSQEHLSSITTDTGGGAAAVQTSVVRKKKSFPFPFFKGNKSDEPKMSIADKAEGSFGGGDLPKRPANTKVNWRDSTATDGSRSIEVKQNWLARLFRVKPATDYLCMSISRRRARQEVTILLREWRRYGIRGIQVDKERNIIFGRVGAKNYLNLKEVSFAAEIMTVIEHGKRQPLSIVRFTQERGAASSFHRVVDTMRTVFDSRHLLVAERTKQKMMIKTLQS
ncbi:serine/threonine-protein kinase-like protein [Emericellopsis cladophorae]|uniref:non-specific serine/threonine protein kinase n=1 Tax=Emericellopsis cladophorae TaxID=2686198 RepID=A0A9P9XWJ9_9HYPO|nr:serine/threonine-protein kinase-like protein [Emericellopsis cladophorae]KAI6778943.1 serine/threonine-protein kinase-like protein [Emericellopsis cladophorae]